MKPVRIIRRLLPVFAALALALAAASCTPQKQYGCPNHLESGATE